MCGTARAARQTHGGVGPSQASITVGPAEGDALCVVSPNIARSTPDTDTESGAGKPLLYDPVPG